MPKQVIPIKCYYDKLISVSSLYSIQENLKEPQNLKELKKSIIANGIVFPSFVWQDSSDDRLKIVDGVHRLKAYKVLMEDGYSIQGVPCIFVKCKSYKEAKEYVLRATSRFAKPTKSGFKGYVEESGLDMLELVDEVSPKDFGFLKDLLVEHEPIEKVGAKKSKPVPEITLEDMEYVVFQIVFDTKDQFDKFWSSMSKIRSMQYMYRNEDYKDILFDLLSRECEGISK